MGIRDLFFIFLIFLVLIIVPVLKATSEFNLLNIFNKKKRYEFDSGAYVKNALTKDGIEIDLYFSFNIKLLENAVKKVLKGINSELFWNQIVNIVEKQTCLVTANFSFKEINENNEMLIEQVKIYTNNEFKKLDIELTNITGLSIHKRIKQEVIQAKKEIKSIKTESEKTFNDEFKRIAQNQIESEKMKPEEQPQEVYEPQTEFTQDSVTNTDETQAKIDDIFASTRKYFENNGNT